jgi:hypothetical protein
MARTLDMITPFRCERYDAISRGVFWRVGRRRATALLNGVERKPRSENAQHVGVGVRVMMEYRADLEISFFRNAPCLALMI